MYSDYKKFNNRTFPKDNIKNNNLKLLTGFEKNNNNYYNIKNTKTMGGNNTNNIKYFVIKFNTNKNDITKDYMEISLKNIYSLKPNIINVKKIEGGLNKNYKGGNNPSNEYEVQFSVELGTNIPTIRNIENRLLNSDTDFSNIDISNVNIDILDKKTYEHNRENLKLVNKIPYWLKNYNSEIILNKFYIYTKSVDMYYIDNDANIEEINQKFVHVTPNSKKKVNSYIDNISKIENNVHINNNNGIWLNINSKYNYIYIDYNKMIIFVPIFNSNTLEENYSINNLLFFIKITKINNEIIDLNKIFKLYESSSYQKHLIDNIDYIIEKTKTTYDTDDEDEEDPKYKKFLAEIGEDMYRYENTVIDIYDKDPEKKQYNNLMKKNYHLKRRPNTITIMRNNYHQKDKNDDIIIDNIYFMIKKNTLIENSLCVNKNTKRHQPTKNLLTNLNVSNDILQQINNKNLKNNMLIDKYFVFNRLKSYSKSNSLFYVKDEQYYPIEINDVSSLNNIKLCRTVD
tara:strand:+ start:9 stop:1547 length:1539 start_codon:yes stop_codon:yes gene_type:complete